MSTEQNILDKLPMQFRAASINAAPKDGERRSGPDPADSISRSQAKSR